MMSYFGVLSEFGGLTEIIFYSVGFIVVWFNKRFERAKLIQGLYFAQNATKFRGLFDFTSAEKLSDWKKYFKQK